MLLFIARMAARLAQQITVYSHGSEELTAQLKSEFEGKPLTIESRKIVAVEQKGENSVIIHLEDGESREESFLVSLAPNISGNILPLCAVSDKIMRRSQLLL